MPYVNFIFLFHIFLLIACDTKESDFKKAIVYDGPVMQMNNVKTLFSDSAIVKVELLAALQNEYLNGDRDFPKGILLYFFDSNGDTTSCLKANHGKLVKATGIYTGTGNVIIRDLKQAKTMNTELLNWNPTTKKIFTDKFVRIQTKTEILTGNGLDADQGFDNYTIRNPDGIFSINQ